MDKIIRQGLLFNAGFDPKSEKEMRAQVENIIASASNINFDTPENKKSLQALISVFRDMFESVGNKKIDFAKMLNLPGPEMFDAFKNSANEMANVWADVVSRMGTNSLRNMFMKDERSLSDALDRLTKNGKLVENRLRNIRQAFKDVRSTDINKLLSDAMGAEVNFRTAETWEERTAAALRYIKIRDKILSVKGSDSFDINDVARHQMDFFKDITDSEHRLGAYFVRDLKEVVPEMQTSLNNIFNLFRKVEIDVVPKVVKVLDVSDVLGGKTSVKVKVTPEVSDGTNDSIDVDFKQKLEALYNAYQNAQHRLAREIESDLLSSVPEGLQKALQSKLQSVMNKSVLKDADYESLWGDFKPYVGTGTGDGSGAGDASSAELEAARSKADMFQSENDRLQSELMEAEKRATEAEQRASMYDRAMQSIQEENNDLRQRLANQDSGTGGGFSLSEEEIENRLSKLDELKRQMSYGGDLNYDDPASSAPEYEIKRLTKIKELYSELTGEKDGAAIDAIQHAIDEASGILEDLKGYRELLKYDPEGRTKEELADSFEQLARSRMRDLDSSLSSFEKYIPIETDFASDDAIRRHRLTSEIFDPSEDDYYGTDELESILETNKSMIAQLEKENLLTDEMRTKYDGINKAIIERIQYQKDYYAAEQAAEKSFDELDTLYDKIGETDDPDEVNSLLAERKRILSEISELVRDDYEESIEGAVQENALIERRIALLRDAKAGKIDIDSVDTIMSETGDLEARFERLKEIAGDWGMNIKDADALEDDEAQEHLKDFEEIYDRIVLKLSNGKDVEILPNAEGLRNLQKYLGYVDSSDEDNVWGKHTIENVEFVRKEIQAHQDNITAINNEAEALKNKADAYDRLYEKIVRSLQASDDAFYDYEEMLAASEQKSLDEYRNGRSIYERARLLLEEGYIDQNTEWVNDDEVENNQKKIQSYNELSDAVSRYVELAKTLVATENKTPEHMQIQRDMDIVDTWGMNSQEDFITAINEWQTNVGKIKAAVKAGADTYKTADGYVESITDDTLSRAESTLRGYIYRYAENWDDIDTLLAGAKTKTLQNIITKEIGKYTADQDIQRQQEEIANAANAAALEEMEHIEKSIEDSALEGKSMDAWSKLSDLKYHANNVDRYTRSSITDDIAVDLGITSPHEEIRNNAQAIKSYEELCEVVQRYNDLTKKRVIFAGDDYPTLNEDEENEFAELTGRLKATKDGVKLTYREIEGDINKLAQLLGIEVPQAAQQAQQAVGSLNNELQETGGNADNINNQVEDNVGPSVGSGQTDGATADEVQNLEAIRAKVAEITAAVEAKTTAFQNEKAAVDTAVGEEVKKLDELEEKVKSIATTIQGLFNNIKNGESNLGEALNNVVVNVNYPKTETDTSQVQLSEVVKQAISEIANRSKVGDAGDKAPWARDDTLRNLTNQKIENIVKNTQKVKINKDGLATNETLNRVAQATEAVATRFKSIQLQTLDPTSIANPIIVVIQNVCAALSKAESAIDQFGNKIGLLNNQNLIVAPSQTNKNNKPSSNVQTGSVGNNGNLYATKTLYIENAGKMEVAKVLEVEKGKTSDALVTTSTLKDNQGQVLQQIVDESYGKFASEKAKEEAKAVKELLKSYEHLGALRAKRDTLPSGATKDELQKEIKLETARLWKRSNKLGVDPAQTKAASDIGKHNVQMEQLIEKTKLLGQYEKDILTMQQDSEQYNNTQKKIRDLNSEISLIQKKITLTQDEKLVLDELRKKNAEAIADKALSQKEAKRQADVRDLEKNYEKLGKAQADAEVKQTEAAKQRVQELQNEINTKQASLQLSQEELAALERISTEEKARQIRGLKADAIDKDFKRQVKDTQRQVGINAATSVANAGDQTVLNAISTNGISKDIQDKAEKLQTQIKALRDVRDETERLGADASDKDRDRLAKQISDVKQLKAEVDGYLKIHEKYSGDNVTHFNDVDTSNFGVAGTTQYWNNITAAIKNASTGRVTIKGMNADTGELSGTTRIAANTFAEWSAVVDPLTGKLSMVRTGIKKTETFIESITRKTKEIFTYFSGSSLIFKVFNELKKGVQYIKEIDLALTEFKKVTDETEESYDEFLKTAAKTGARLGSTISAVTEATATFAKLGYSMEQAAEMAEAAIVYKNVGDNIASTEDAADSIISTLKGFGLEASESMAIVDRFNEVGEQNCPSYIVIYG